MHREFAAIEGALGEFVTQPDDPTLLVQAADHDVVVLLKMMQSLDRRMQQAIFLVFPFACDSVQAYLRQCLDALAVQIAAENAARTNTGAPPWAPLPLVCMDAGQPPAVRLRATVEHVRTLVPAGAPIVWAWLPATLADAEGFRQMVLPLLAIDGFEPWMEGHRFCIRDDAGADSLGALAQARRAAHVLLLPVDFSGGRVFEHLLSTAGDEACPMRERMDALMQLAAFDLAHKRFDDARLKYRALYAYHSKQGQPVGKAQALHGIGDCALHEGAVAEAKRWYLRAIPVALEAKNLTMVLNALMASGDCCSRLGEHARAAIYFELASRSAGRIMFPHAKIEAMQRLGDALLASNDVAGAARSWIDAKGLAEQFGCDRLRMTMLDRLANLYAKAGLKAEAKAYEREKLARAGEHA
ncbi:tetratricopeptide repeat protein [Trinickia fusca]|uniref:Tetratricopeptide repeat protein n=1 Tax=Trinickia fusca TaxID=2419777 RepID=A0A494X1D0_9BURK|nr:hypothetical protein [Trinickia fusca]RKP44527.1 hypothetical protein D7S89_21815 [Trinickia fusca]